jgi:NADPH-dependent 2,4-dienoyl-CoA reductase/sulfur reductase-like enzyme/nitrite reductase/ring-hydroxylating ferredoxin subunit
LEKLMSDKQGPEGPDFKQGIALAALGDGAKLVGRVGEEPVLLARCGEEIFAIGALCTHYQGPLAEGILVGDTVRCPWHHACFSLRSGEAVRAPALESIARWRVERRDGKIYVSEKIESPARPEIPAGPGVPRSIVVLGGGAAGNAAAEMLRREGFAGSITMLSADESVPCDRPNLSKDYLAGDAPEEWVPLRPPEFYREHKIDLRLGARATGIDPKGRTVTLADGSRHSYEALLLATGAEPVRLNVPGADGANVHYLRTLADSRAIIAAAKNARRVVIVGASFIGLEVAASLRKRKLEVHVVGPEARPLERIVGPEIGDLVRTTHEEHGVIFHLGAGVAEIGANGVQLASGENLPADFVVVGIGVRPAIALAEQAGLAIDRGVSVNRCLETSVPGIFAAGDIARWPDPLTGERIRVEHWVVAERQGQVAARNMLGRHEPFNAVPFFWSQHYDFSIRYVGHAEKWDKTTIAGDVAAKDCEVAYFRDGRKLAVATVSRDIDNLKAEVAFEAVIAAS